MREIDREKRNNLEEAERFLKDQIVNNKQLEDSIKQSEKELVTIRDEQHKITEATSAYAIEVKKLIFTLYLYKIYIIFFSYKITSSNKIVYY